MAEEIVSLARMQLTGWLYLAVVTIASSCIISISFGLSVLAGGMVSLVSFMISHRDLTGFLASLLDGEQETEEADEKEGKKAKLSKKGFLIKFWIRIAVIGAVLLLLIKSGQVNVFGLILGLSTMVFTVAFTAISVARYYLFSGRS